MAVNNPKAPEIIVVDDDDDDDDDDDSDLFDDSPPTTTKEESTSVAQSSKALVTSADSHTTSKQDSDNDDNDDNSSTEGQDYLPLPLRQANQCRFPPGCLVLVPVPRTTTSNDDHHQNHNQLPTPTGFIRGRVQQVVINFVSQRRENLYRIQLLLEETDHDDHSLIADHHPTKIFKTEPELQFAPSCPVWLSLSGALLLAPSDDVHKVPAMVVACDYFPANESEGLDATTLYSVETFGVGDKHENNVPRIYHGVLPSQLEYRFMDHNNNNNNNNNEDNNNSARKISDASSKAGGHFKTKNQNAATSSASSGSSSTHMDASEQSSSVHQKQQQNNDKSTRTPTRTCQSPTTPATALEAAAAVAATVATGASKAMLHLQQPQEQFTTGDPIMHTLASSPSNHTQKRKRQGSESSSHHEDPASAPTSTSTPDTTITFFNGKKRYSPSRRHCHHPLRTTNNQPPPPPVAICKPIIRNDNRHRIDEALVQLTRHYQKQKQQQQQQQQFPAILLEHCLHFQLQGQCRDDQNCRNHKLLSSRSPEFQEIVRALQPVIGRNGPIYGENI